MVRPGHRARSLVRVVRGRDQLHLRPRDGPGEAVSAGIARDSLLERVAARGRELGGLALPRRTELDDREGAGTRSCGGCSRTSPRVTSWATRPPCGTRWWSSSSRTRRTVCWAAESPDPAHPL